MAQSSCSFSTGTTTGPAPQRLRAIERDGAVDLLWSPVEVDGVLGYRVFVSSGDPTQAPYELAVEVDRFTETATIGGLTNSTAYRFVVRTVSELGVAEPSEPALAAPFSVTSVPIAGFDVDEECDIVILADGSRYRLPTREETTSPSGRAPGRPL